MEVGELPMGNPPSWSGHPQARPKPAALWGIPETTLDPSRPVPPQARLPLSRQYPVHLKPWPDSLQ